MTNEDDRLDDLDGDGRAGVPPVSAPAAARSPAAFKTTAAASDRKGMLLGVLVLVAALFCGAYYYLAGITEDVPPPRTAQVSPLPSPDPAPIQPPAVPAPVAEGPAAVVSVPAAADASPVLPPSPEPKADATTPVTAPNAMPPPPADEEAEAPGLIASPIAVASMPPAEAETPASMDLPVPTEELPPALSAPQDKPAVQEEKKAEKTPDPAVPPADAAEQALLDNAPMLDKVSAPKDAALVKMPEDAAQAAIIRPLPGKYLVVHKDTGADDVDARLSAARSALASGRNQAALALFDDMKKQYPKDARILMGRAIALQNLGQTDAALEGYREVLNRDPKNIEALTNMLGLLKSQDPTAALDKLTELHARYPANADIVAQLGVASGIAGDYQAAIKYLDMAEALSPGNISFAYNKAIVYDRMGSATQAAALYRQVLERAAAGGTGGQLPLDAIRARLGALR